MKNTKLLLALLFLLVSCATCLAQDRPRVLIVYYSRDGHTRLVAEALAKKFGADTEELIDKKSRTGAVGSAAAGKDALAKKLTKIAALKKEPADYDTILIGTPSWFSNPAPAVRTFVSKYSFKAKTVGVFGTAHLTGIDACLERLARMISEDNAAGVPRLALVHKELEPERLKEKIDRFYEKLTVYAKP